MPDVVEKHWKGEKQDFGLKFASIVKQVTFLALYVYSKAKKMTCCKMKQTSVRNLFSLLSNASLPRQASSLSYVSGSLKHFQSSFSRFACFLQLFFARPYASLCRRALSRRCAPQAQNSNFHHVFSAYSTDSRRHNATTFSIDCWSSVAIAISVSIGNNPISSIYFAVRP